MVGGQVFTKDGHQAAGRENPPYVIEACRMVGEVVSDYLISGADGKREGNWNFLIGSDLFPNPIDPVFDQIVLQARDAGLVEPVFHENDVSEHDHAGTERPDPAPDGCGQTALRQKENREDLNVSGRRVSFVDPFERCLDGRLLSLIPGQRHTGRINGNVDPSSGAGEGGVPSNVRLVAGDLDGLPARAQRTPSEVGGSDGARRTSRASDYAPFPVPLLGATVLAFLGLAGAVRGWRKEPDWLFLMAMLALILGTAGIAVNIGFALLDRAITPAILAYPFIGAVLAIVCGCWSGRSLILGHAVSHAVGWLGGFVGTVLFLLGMASLYVQVLP